MSKLDTIVKEARTEEFNQYISRLKIEIQEAYKENDAPWIICFSGGKDSTALLQLICYALSEIEQENLTKEIHILANDTLVENPEIEKYLDEQLSKIKIYGKENLYRHAPGSFFVEKGKPELEERFWINLIGRGYPSPNRWFRWCTERLKINPTSKYIESSLKRHKQVIIVLGTRKAESANRAMSMNKYDSNGRFRDHTLTNAKVYAPIAEMSTDDVWSYLLLKDNPWGGDNMDLLDIYGNACTGGECPFVIETGTQSCGKSRFGCWVCTVVDRDKSMENFIINGENWLKGLLKYRNWLYEIRQQDNQYVPDNINREIKFGPFLLKTRKKMLAKLLRLQKQSRIELIDDEELKATRKILKGDNKAKSTTGMKRYIYEMCNGKKVAVISDCNITAMNRERLGSIHLDKIKLIKSEDVDDKYKKSTRMMYYRI